MKKIFAAGALLFIAEIALASDGSAEHGIPAKMIFIQSVNFSLAVGLLIYFTNKTIKNHFKARHEDFFSEVNKAEKARKEAETVKREIVERLTKLKNTQEESLKTAKAEAETLKKKIITDADLVAKKLLEDAKKTSELEKNKASELLRQELLLSSVKLAEQKMKEQVNGADLKRMKVEFVEKIQVVR
jgi:F-type H+-transporting ATPase subunit b